LNFLEYSLCWDFNSSKGKKARDDPMNARGAAWFVPNTTLTSQGLADDECVLLRKKFFVSDHTVDLNDPIQLMMIYNEAYLMIINGNYNLTAAEASEFGGIQMYILYGNQDPQKHKTSTYKFFLVILE
jgi:talin